MSSGAYNGANELSKQPALRFTDSCQEWEATSKEQVTWAPRQSSGLIPRQRSL